MLIQEISLQKKTDYFNTKKALTFKKIVNLKMFVGDVCVFVLTKKRDSYCCCCYIYTYMTHLGGD